MTAPAPHTPQRATRRQRRAARIEQRRMFRALAESASERSEELKRFYNALPWWRRLSESLRLLRGRL